MSDWNKLENKLNEALEHTEAELAQIAQIYKRRGKADHAREVENTIKELRETTESEI